MKIRMIMGVGIMCGITALAVPRADRSAAVDAEGVLRWKDNGEEIAMFGVNYYPPFTIDYMQIKELGLDHREVMRQDVAHFRRLGLSCIRIHCFERQFSTKDGAFLDNHHVELLDFLIDLCAKEGMYTVLTPIAWWGGNSWVGKTDGFSDHFPMKKMTTDRVAWKAQARFLRAFVEHVNRFTGKQYADDPAILAFECINEPLYPPDTPDGLVTEYVNTLVDALRAGGTRKPIYYNSWQGRNAAVAASRADGVTGSYYPTGLLACHALEGPQLFSVKASTLRPDASIAKKSRMIYEFDAADTPGSYMYPPMAKLFRSEGVQIAAQFQYDPMALAHQNLNWQTHYLNMIYTPRKALSLAIAAHVFRDLPRGGTYVPAKDELAFGAYFVSATNDLSECVTDSLYLYTNTPRRRPKNLSALRHVWGCGDSALVRWPGNGIYFLDRVADGVWRLQVYPDVFECADPYTGAKKVNTIVLETRHPMTVSLPDLGGSFTVWSMPGKLAAGKAKEGTVTLASGDYLLTRSPDLPVAPVMRKAEATAPAFIAPPPCADHTPRLRVRIPSQWRVGHAMPVSLSSAFVDSITASVCSVRPSANAADNSVRTLPSFEKTMKFPADMFPAGEYGIRFTVKNRDDCMDYPFSSESIAWMPRTDAPRVDLLSRCRTEKPKLSFHRCKMDCSASWTEDGLWMDLASFKEEGACAGCQFPLNGKKMDPFDVSEYGLRLRIENRSSSISFVEVGFRLTVGTGLACNLTLHPGINDVVVYPSDMVKVWGLVSRKDFRWQDVCAVSVLSGSWLYRETEVPAQRLLFREMEWVPVRPVYRVVMRENAREWEFLDCMAAFLPSRWFDTAHRCKTLDDAGRPAICLRAEHFLGEKSFVGFAFPCDSVSFADLFPAKKLESELVIHARACDPQTTMAEFVMIMRDGSPWGINLPLTETWRDIRIPLNKLRFFEQWNVSPRPAAGTVPEIRNCRSFNLCIGKWLFPKTADKPHAFEISSIRVE